MLCNNIHRNVIYIVTLIINTNILRKTDVDMTNVHIHLTLLKEYILEYFKLRNIYFLINIYQWILCYVMYVTKYVMLHNTCGCILCNIICNVTYIMSQNIYVYYVTYIL